VVVARQCSGIAQPDGGVTPAGFRLTVMQGSASAPGVITSTPAGISCGTASNICAAAYLPNTTVTLRIDPGMMGRFVGWAGCDVADGERCLVTMTADRSVTATFRAANSPALELTVTGNGQVSGGGLSCRAGSGVCTATYSPGEIVELTALPDATETFLGWGGACAAFARATPINVEMAVSRSCSAQFTGAPGNAPQVAVSLEPAQIGPVVGFVRSVPEGLTCGSIGSDCSQTFAAGTAVRLDAVSTDANWEFESFRCAGGIQTAGARSLSFVAEQDVSCIAAFASDVERLRVKIVSDLFAASPGRVVSQGTTAPRHLDCNDDCDRPFTRDTFVTLRAEADASHVFANWSGCDSLSVDPSGALAPLCHVTMSRTRNVHAAFTAEHVGTGDNQHVLSIDFPFDSGDGSVEYNRPAGLPPCTPQGGACAHTYDRTSGTTDDVLLTIRPAGNNTLVLNEGCAVFTPANGTDPATCRVTMDRDRGVTFGFNTVNAAPLAVISRTPAGAVAVNEAIEFSGAASTDDEDVSQLSFQWDFDGDSITDTTGITASHAFAQPGVYPVRLMVVDRFGSLDIEYTDVEVIAANAPPTAFFIYSPGIPLVGNSVSFDASASSDSNGIATYRWDFDGDGVDDVIGDASTARVVGHTFNAFGTYTVRLRVIDNLGAVGETTRQVSVALASGGTTLTLNLLGNGHGVVAYVPIVSACSKDSEPTCVRQFPQGTQVVLSATAYSGSALGDWVGCTSLNAQGTECTVNLNINRTVSLFIN
jgi:PKD repeat protein